MTDQTAAGWDDVAKVAQAQGRVSVQADCTIDEALALMQDHAVKSQHRLIDIANAVPRHELWFD